MNTSLQVGALCENIWARTQSLEFDLLEVHALPKAYLWTSTSEHASKGKASKASLVVEAVAPCHDCLWYVHAERWCPVQRMSTSMLLHTWYDWHEF